MTRWIKVNEIRREAFVKCAPGGCGQGVGMRRNCIATASGATGVGP